VIIEMRREDIKITILDSFTPDSFHVFFYETGPISVKMDTIDSLIGGLRLIVEGMPGASLSVKS
jgi:hypothetical protein